MTNEVTVTIKLDADVKEAAETDEIPFVKKKSAAGMLSEYANPAMIPFENEAWSEAAVKRYVKNLG